MSDTTPDTTDTPDPVDTPTAPDGYVSQAEVDRIIQERLARQSKKYADYDQLQAAAAKWAEVEESNKTELQKAQEAAQAAQAELTALRDRLRTQTITSALTQAATAAGAINPAQVVKLLDLDVDLDDDGNITTDIASAVTTFLGENPHLVGKGTSPAPTPTLPAVPGVAKTAEPSQSVTMEDIAKMDPRELAKNPEALKAAIAARNLIN